MQFFDSRGAMVVDVSGVEVRVRVVREGLVGLAWLLRISAFAVAAILSGFEAENVAVGLAAARRGLEIPRRSPEMSSRSPGKPSGASGKLSRTPGKLSGAPGKLSGALGKLSGASGKLSGRPGR